MERVNYPMTIDELIRDAIRAKEIYGGDKYVLLSNDEEGNGFHECYYTFTRADNECGYEEAVPGIKAKDCVLLG